MPNCYPLLLLLFSTMSIYSTRRDSGTLNGRYTKSIENYKLAVPHRRNVDGDFVSFNLPQFFKHDPRMKRKKRSHVDEDMVHYGLRIDGKDYHVELWPNHEVLSPNVIFERREPKLRVGDRKIETLRDKRICHYTGYVREKRGSRAALSTCDGLAGYILIDNVRYFIEPVEEHQANKEGHHLHVVYRSSPDAERGKRGKCGTKINWEDVWKQRLKEKYLRDGDMAKRYTESEHRYLETLVVADKKFIAYHKNRDVENYILTIMNMVADFYHDSSSGNQLDVVIVRIIYLEKEEEEIDLVINQDADKTLESFCKWQQRIRPKDVENPNHHDIAVLLTRYDICSSDEDGCGLMGLAYVASPCTSNENCAINEDGGLVLGVVVAHEMGHVMGCSHDKEGESACPAQDKDLSFFIMAPFVHIHTLRWSPCSKEFITALFDNNLGDCLSDESQITLYDYKNALPGTIYDANVQCDLTFPGSTYCDMNQDEFCEILMCRTEPDACMSNGEPPADGTKCGTNKWCFENKCVEIGQRPDATNGGWGSWGTWSRCSRTCGGGVSISERGCDNPIPQHRGKYCIGERKKIKICNMIPCPAGSPTFREFQCAEHNSQPFNGAMHKWKPFLKDDEPCVLYCVNEAHGFAKLEPRVKDGTPCRAGSKNMCIGGKCRVIGCDNKLDSVAVEDICGICNGDGTQCKIIEEVYKDSGARDYKKIATIPTGSRQIRVEELAPSMNTIAISDKSEKVFYLNGNHVEVKDGEYTFGKVKGVYSHPEPGKETLVIGGPTLEDLILFVVFYRPDNVGYRYKYAEATSDLTYSPKYHWELLDWSECSARCGGGLQVSNYGCVEDRAGKVSSTFCVGEDKPEPETKSCNELPCKTKWKVGKWSKCYACKNLSGVRIREVVCVQESPRQGAEDILIDDYKCEGVKPSSRELCKSHKQCRAIGGYIDRLPNEMLREVWDQIQDGLEKNKKRSLSIDNLVEVLNSNDTELEQCMKNKTNVTLEVGKMVIDRIPKEEIKLIRVPLRQSHLSLNLSDEGFKQMGDSVGDNIDTGHAEISTGNDAAMILKKLRHPKGRAKKGHGAIKKHRKHGKTKTNGD